MVPYKRISLRGKRKNRKLGTSQLAAERKMENSKLKDRIRNTIIRQRSAVADIAENITGAKWAEHTFRMNNNRRTIRHAEWLKRGVRSVGRLNAVGEMTSWDKRNRYWQGQQMTEKVGGLWWRATSWSGRTQPRKKKKTNRTEHLVRFIVVL